MFLPRTSVEAVVVNSLDVVDAGLLIGADRVGGVRLEYDKRKRLCCVCFGSSQSEVVCSVASDSNGHLLWGVDIKRDESSGDVVLQTADGEVKWISESGHWELKWQWTTGQPPSAFVGSGVSEYSRSHLSPEQERQFCDEVNSWIQNDWLIEHDSEVHEEVAGVLPLSAQAQPHKLTTLVRPCLDY